MLIKITEKCSMGCSHCFDNATPVGDDMSMKTFVDILDFLVTHNIGKFLVISGAEPTEHPQFEEFMYTLFDYATRYPENFYGAIVTTNGVEILKNQEKYKKIALDGIKAFTCNRPNLPKPIDQFTNFAFQVSADVRFYPKRIDITKRVFREPGFALFDDRVIKVVNMGRARTNHLGKEFAAPQCINCRLIANQVYIKQHPGNNLTLSEIEMNLLQAAKSCVPSISVKGDIKLGESMLCKPCASIYDEEKEIIEKMVKFTCDGCKEEIDKLDPITKLLLSMPIL